jgi:hypothetical protein
VRLLAFSDLHRDLDQAASLAERSSEADVVIAAGDFASVHEGLEETIEALRPISVPTVLVPGNNETETPCAQPARAGTSRGCSTGRTQRLTAGTLRPRRGNPDHALGLELRPERGAGGRAPRTLPRGRRARGPLAPKGHCDTSSSGDHLGSEAILEAIETKRPPLAVCGHIHEAWGAEDEVGETKVINLGPSGRLIDV